MITLLLSLSNQRPALRDFALELLHSPLQLLAVLTLCAERGRDVTTTADTDNSCCCRRCR